MALGDAYATSAELKAYGKITDTLDDATLSRILSAVSRSVEMYCERQFNDSGTVSARVFHPATDCSAWVDDFSTATGLVVKIDEGDDGTYNRTIDAADFTLLPLNGVTAEGISGFPYNRIDLATSSTYFRTRTSRPSLEVTAQWGWSSVPDAVTHATLIKAAKVFGRSSSPHGAAVIGAGDFVFRISRQEDPDVAELLEPYRFAVPMVA